MVSYPMGINRLGALVVGAFDPGGVVAHVAAYSTNVLSIATAQQVEVAFPMGEDRPVPQTMDWGVGRYESTAERLLPAAQGVVERASLKANEHVLDLGCGTGNAALLAAAC